MKSIYYLKMIVIANFQPTIIVNKKLINIWENKNGKESWWSDQCSVHKNLSQ